MNDVLKVNQLDKNWINFNFSYIDNLGGKDDLCKSVKAWSSGVCEASVYMVRTATHKEDFLEAPEVFLKVKRSYSSTKTKGRKDKYLICYFPHFPFFQKKQFLTAVASSETSLQMRVGQAATVNGKWRNVKIKGKGQRA